MLCRLYAVCVAVVLAGCTGMPDGVEPVSGFEAERYLGRWYEIARLDHSFERGLDGVNANYSFNDDGSVRVLNRGFDVEEGGWDEAEGVARFVQDSSVGHLKVSFFGPFYGSYVVFELDKADYQYAFVSGFNRSYLWLLARTPTVDEALKRRFVTSAEALGFATEDLVWVDQSRNETP
ncbi:lipocalin family protein [Pseudohaliea rubra]|uniref:Outer membrane lipoprotein Blc n=1 Tax=Pseudohaliea rubra DSM 19751 TaxID=1265313 RepID=A0A095VNT1_9GAMM|nr:lipocalin family protein [Pseudohaliea rubra]KGE02773.1 lipoprotein Blc [Pseudohaliea rubra DSM 19751]